MSVWLCTAAPKIHIRFVHLWLSGAQLSGLTVTSLKDHAILHLASWTASSLTSYSKRTGNSCKITQKIGIRAGPKLASLFTALATHLTRVCFVYFDHCLNISIWMQSVCSVVHYGLYQQSADSFGKEFSRKRFRVCGLCGLFRLLNSATYSTKAAEIIC